MLSALDYISDPLVAHAGEPDVKRFAHLLDHQVKVVQLHLGVVK